MSENEDSLFIINHTRDLADSPIELVEADSIVLIQVKLFEQDLDLGFAQAFINFQNQLGELVDSQCICLCFVLQSVKLVDVSLLFIQSFFES